MLASNYHKVDVRVLCAQILESSIKDKSKYQLGLTKIFFRAGLLAGFEQYRSTKLNALATLIQKNFQRYMAVKQYQNLRRTTIGLQSIWRARLAKRLMEQMRRDAAVILIQKNARGYLQRLRYKRTTLAIVAVQSRASPSRLLYLFMDQGLIKVYDDSRPGCICSKSIPGRSSRIFGHSITKFITWMASHPPHTAIVHPY